MSTLVWENIVPVIAKTELPAEVVVYLLNNSTIGTEIPKMFNPTSLGVPNPDKEKVLSYLKEQGMLNEEEGFLKAAKHIVDASSFNRGMKLYVARFASQDRQGNRFIQLVCGSCADVMPRIMIFTFGYIEGKGWLPNVQITYLMEGFGFEEIKTNLFNFTSDLAYQFLKKVLPVASGAFEVDVANGNSLIPGVSYLICELQSVTAVQASHKKNLKGITKGQLLEHKAGVLYRIVYNDTAKALQTICTFDFENKRQTNPDIEKLLTRDQRTTYTDQGTSWFDYRIKNGEIQENEQDMTAAMSLFFEASHMKRHSRYSNVSQYVVANPREWAGIKDLFSWKTGEDTNAYRAQEDGWKFAALPGLTFKVGKELL